MTRTNKSVTPAERSRRSMGDVSALAAICVPGTFLVAEDGYDWMQGTLAGCGLKFEAKATATPRSTNLCGGRLRMLSVYDDAVRTATSDYAASQMFAFDAPFWERPMRAEHLPILRSILAALDDRIALTVLGDRLARAPHIPSPPSLLLIGEMSEEAHALAARIGLGAAASLCRDAVEALSLDPTLGTIEVVAERDAHRWDDLQHARIALYHHRHPRDGERLGAATCLQVHDLAASPALATLFRIERHRQLFAHFFDAAPLEQASELTLAIDRRGCTIASRPDGTVIAFHPADGSFADPSAGDGRIPDRNEPRVI